MGVIAYINFKGNCREAVEFYAKAFGAATPNLVTFADLPPDPARPLDEATKKLVMHTELVVDGSTLMFSDTPPGMSHTQGDNITLMLQGKDAAAIKRWFGAIKVGGEVVVDLGPESWSKLYGLVHDRFGIGWQFNLVE
ncbi:MAG: VOC family protein [Spirochaetota bacterium]